MKPARTGSSRPPEPSATVTVHVAPRSAREEVAGFSGGVLRVRLTAPPVENRANEALVRFLSDALGVARRRVELVTGARGRNKIVRVRGLSLGEVFRRLGLEKPPD